MTFFGRYLVEQGIVSEGVIIKTLVEQMRSVPPIAEVFFTLNLVSIEDQLKVIETQMEKGIEYRAACRLLGLWNDKVENTVIAHIKKSRIPLGQLLVINKLISFDELVRCLDDYFVHRNDSPNVKVVTKSDAPLPPSGTVVAQSVEVASSWVAGDIVWVESDTTSTEIVEPLPQMDASLALEFGDLFSEVFYSELKTIALQLSDDKNRQHLSNGLIAHLRTVKSGSVFMRANKTSEMIAALTQSLLKEATDKEQGVKASTIVEGIELLWSLRTAIVSKHSEQEAWNDKMFREKFEAIFKILSV